VVPAIAIAPYGGVLADRGDRVRLLAWSQGIGLLLAVAMSAASYAGLLSIGLLMASAVGLGLVDGVNQPARMAIVSDLAPRRLLPPTVALNSFCFNTARFIGPSAAGYTLWLDGPGLAFAANAATFVPLIAFLVRFGRAHARTPEAMVDRPGSDGVMAGIGYAASHAVIAHLLALLIVTAFFARPFVELLPALAAELFDASPATLARLTAAMGAGAMAGGVLMLSRKIMAAVLYAALAAPAGVVLGLFTFLAASGSAWIAIPALMLTGFSIVVSGVGMQSIIHLTAASAYRGRLLALFTLFMRAGPALGALLIGFSADVVGLRGPLVAAGLIAGLFWIVIWRRRTRLAGCLEAPFAT
jgi:Transmembrane secretion effector